MKASPYMLNKANFEYAKKKAKELGKIYKECELADYLHMTKQNFSLIKNNNRPCQEIYLRQLGELWGVNWKWLAGEDALYLKAHSDYFNDLESTRKALSDFMSFLSDHLAGIGYDVKFNGIDPLCGCEIDFLDKEGNEKSFRLSPKEEVCLIQYITLSFDTFLDNTISTIGDYKELSALFE